MIPIDPLVEPHPSIPIDPLVEPIDQALQSISEPRDPDRLLAKPEPAGHAMWLCRCYQDDYAPTWLLFETPAGDLGWCRVPGETEYEDLVHVHQLDGGHTDSAGVLSWIRGATPDPWVTDMDRTENTAAVQVFTRLVRNATGSDDLGSAHAR